MRVFTSMGCRHGPLLAAGCAYNLFFSMAAMLPAGFSILGLVLSGNRELQLAIIRVVDQYHAGTDQHHRRKGWDWSHRSSSSRRAGPSASA